MFVEFALNVNLFYKSKKKEFWVLFESWWKLNTNPEEVDLYVTVLWFVVTLFYSVVHMECSLQLQRSYHNLFSCKLWCMSMGSYVKKIVNVTDYQLHDLAKIKKNTDCMCCTWSKHVTDYQLVIVFIFFFLNTDYFINLEN